MNPNNIYREGATGALLDIYEKAIADLNQLISSIPNEDLIIVIDPFTEDVNCKSVQTILSHVVSAGFNYVISIRNLKDEVIPYREKIFHHAIADYQNDLRELFHFSDATLKEINDNELEQVEDQKKIISRWETLYTIEQMMEHAIVHILRHARQIERFNLKLANKQDVKGREEQ